MINLSQQIESGLNTVLEGLELEIELDHKIQENEYYNYINYNIVIESSRGFISKGIIVRVEDDSVIISVKDKQKGSKETFVEKTFKFSTIKTARVFDNESAILEPDRMKQIIASKTTSFDSAKTMMHRWMTSPNAPSEDKVRLYINKIVKAGEKSLDFLRKALSHDIDYSMLETHKIHAATAAKPIILNAIFELDASINELRSKLDGDDLFMGEQDFKLGYPERFAKGEFYPAIDYFNDWYDEKMKAVKICPFGSKGKYIKLDDLGIYLPEVPEDKSKILFSNLKKKDQYWRRQEPPKDLNSKNSDKYDEYIKEEFRRRREGIWFMNNGKPVYLTGNHYFALQWCKMLDSGGYMDFRYAQLNMFYHLEACIVDKRCLGQLFVKSRRTGFTYTILSILLNQSTSTRNKNYGMTSKSNDDAQKAFLKYRYMLINLPFFFLPIIKGKLDSTQQFEFNAPADNTRKTKKLREENRDDYLNTMVDFQPTKNDSYDGQAMAGYLGDECFAPDTKILMADMSFKVIQDIEVGEYVMNGKGVPTRVAKKFEGVAEMYKVLEPYGEDYIVNGNHRLVFEKGKDKKSTKDIIIKPNEYLELPDSQKRLFRRKVFKGVQFDETKLPIDPYVFGAWLGDGYSNTTQFIFNHKKDKELLEYIKDYFIQNGFGFAIREESDNWQKYYISDKTHKKVANQVTGTQHRFKKSLEQLGVWGQKRIPKCYLLSSRRQRLELLAGIIDTDGYSRNNNGYDIAMSRKGLIEDIYNLSKSLGLDTSCITTKKTNFNTLCYRLQITDYEAIIPCKLTRKKSVKSETKNRRGKIAGIEPQGLGKYVGIQIEAETDEDRELVLSSYSLSMNCSKWKKPHDYVLHLGQVTPTMLQGGRVVGKAFLGSTVGAMSEGGEQFKEIYNGSNPLERDPVTNMTSTGLYRYFLAAQDNMEAFTDKYGVCYTETPEEPTYNVEGELIKVGSIEYLISQEELKKRKSDKALNEQYRAFPRTINYAFRDESNEGVFNKTKIYDQLEFNEKLPEESKYMVGNFDWKNGMEDSEVIFNPNPEGRFKVSWLPSVIDGTEQLANQVGVTNGGLFYPLNTECVRFGCDPFSLKSTHGEGSKGAIHGKTITLPEGGAPSNKFVVEYIARPSDETIFFEDVIKVIRYYGAPILVESNRIDLLRHMRNRGYRKFSMNRLDKPDKSLNPNEKEYGGQPMAGKDMLDSHMNKIGAWIEANVGEMRDESFNPTGEYGEMPFDETLTDWLNFDPDKRTKHDATISSGLAIMACSTEDYKGKKQEKKATAVVTFLKTFKN